MKILVPIDFSERSIKALDIANQFAGVMDGTVTPFYAHVPITEFDEPYALGMGADALKDFAELEKTFEQRVNEEAREIVDEDRLAEAIVTLGNAPQSIIDISKDFDYIIMSSHGRTGFSRFLLGSVAEKVLRLAHTPVMIVEDDIDVGNFDRILVTTDFSDNAAQAYPYALEIAQKTGGTIDLIHILSFDHLDDDEQDLSLKKIRDERLRIIEKEYFHQIPADRIRTKIIVSDDSPHEAIYHHTNEHDYNLLIMATVGRTGLNYLMMGSTTANVVRHVHTAVLSINPKKL